MEYKSHSNDFESNEDEFNHEISMTKKPNSIQVRTLDNFQDKKESKVIKVLQKVNDKMVDIIAEAK